RSSGTSSRLDRARSARIAAAPGSSSTASHSAPDKRVSTAVRVRNARCAPETRARNSDSRYSLTSRSSPPNEHPPDPPTPPARPPTQPRQTPPGPPPPGPSTQPPHSIAPHPPPGRTQQRRRFPTGQRQLSRADLSDPALRPEPGDPQRRRVPARQRQPGP